MCTHASHVPNGQDHAFPSYGTTPPRSGFMKTAASVEKQDGSNLALSYSYPPMQPTHRASKEPEHLWLITSCSQCLLAFVGGAKGVSQTKERGSECPGRQKRRELPALTRLRLSSTPVREKSWARSYTNLYSIMYPRTVVSIRCVAALPT
jgi:hypothetical protein